MINTLLKGLWKAIKSGLFASLVWTCGFSAILWFFSKPSIPYLNFIRVLGPYALAVFGTVALVLELSGAFFTKKPA